MVTTPESPIPSAFKKVTGALYLPAQKLRTKIDSCAFLLLPCARRRLAVLEQSQPKQLWRRLMVSAPES